MPLAFVSENLAAYVEKLGYVWISAEITEWNPRGSNTYGTFEDGDYKFGFSIFSGDRCDLPTEPIRLGDQVTALVTPRFWAKGGRTSLKVKAIRLAGIGALIAQVEERRMRLRAEGLFDPAHKKTWPLLPSCIGLVVGEQTMAERDVITNAQALWPHVTFRVVRARVQGPECAPSVIEALRVLEADDQVEVIIVARGGGDYRDLVGFSDEALIRYVHAMTTPVISAIGHEPDHPILDDVADARASTPTGAGKMVVMDTVSEFQFIAEQRRRVQTYMSQRIVREGERIHHLRARLLSPETQIRLMGEDIARKRDRINQAITRLLDSEHAKIEKATATLRALSPHRVLERGYALAYVNGSVITQAADAPIGTTITLAFQDGKVDTAVLRQELNP